VSTRNRGAARGAVGSGDAKPQKPTEYKHQEGTEGPSASCGTCKDARTEPWCHERTEQRVQGMRQERRDRNRVPVTGKDLGAE